MSEYSFNPITGKLDRTGSGTTPPSSITINSDSGPPITGNDFTIEGQKALVAPVMETFNDVGNTYIINNAWETQYIVDQSTTRGLKGTFQTIQDAIDQIQIDAPSYAQIRIRAGNYVEVLTIDSAIPIDFVGVCETPSTNSPTGIVTLDTNFIITGTGGKLSFSNLAIFATETIIATFDQVGWFVNLYNCSIYGEFHFENGAGAKYERVTQSSATFITDGNFTAINSVLPTVNVFGSSTAVFQDCNDLTTSFVLNVLNTASVTAVNCRFQQITGNSSGTITLFNSILNNASSFNGTIIYSDLSTRTNGNLFGATTIPAQRASTQGNIIVRKTVSDDYNILNTNYYIGVTDTSAPRSLVLPVTGVSKDQVFIINDESGLAGTNNITVTVQGGALINGQSSAIIDLNYESISFIFDGTNYFTLNSINDSAITINANSGPAITDNEFFIEGQTSGSAQSIDTYNDTGVTNIVDRTFVTEYVVDPSSTPGLQGTFTGLQEAIDAVIADGRDVGRTADILMRPGTYSGDVVFNSPTGSFNIYSMNPSGINQNNGEGVTISGTFTATCTFLTLTNITISGNVTLGAQTSLNACSFSSGFTNSSDTFLINSTLGAATISAGLTAYQCQLGAITCNSTLTIEEGSITSLVVSDPANVSITNATVLAITGSTSGVIQIFGCIYGGNDAGINPTANIEYSDLQNISSAALNPFGSNPTLKFITNSQGNVYQSRRTAISTTIANTDYYVAASGHAAPIIFTLPDTSNVGLKPRTNQIFVFADEQGTAATNTITIATNGGTINGGASVILNRAYETITVIFNGTNYFASSSANLTLPLTVPLGGTGATTFTDHGVLIGSGTSAVDSLAVGSNGQLLVGSTGADPVFATLASILGTITRTAGAGTLNIDVANYATGTWTPTVTGQTTAGTTTYSVQAGYYTRFLDLCWIHATIIITNATGTGNMIVGGLPFTVKNQVNGSPNGAIRVQGAGLAWPAGTTQTTFSAVLNSTTGIVFCTGSSSAGGQLQMANTSFSLTFSAMYQV
jgi:hypothetical protein